MKLSKLVAVSALLLCVATLSHAQSTPKTGKGGYPIYNDVSIPRPDKSTKITAEDLKLTDKYIDLYPEGIPEADQQTLRKLYKFFKEDRDGQKEWKSLTEKTIKVISAWDMRAVNNRRYVYTIGEVLKPLAKVYVFTGNELISDFICAHLKRVAPMPIDFWVHAELRRLIKDKPQGYIETSYVNQAMGTLLNAVRRNLTDEELATFESAWYQKGYIPGLNWLEANPDFTGNFKAVVAIGVMYASRYFNDPQGWQKGVEGLKFYMDNAILPDGSNYEGYGYFDYPVLQILKVTSIMTPEEISSLFAGTGLKGSQSWRVAGMLLGKDENGHPGVFRMTFGDNVSCRKIWHCTDGPVLLARSVCQDPVSAWVFKNWKQTSTQYGFLLQQKFAGADVKPLSPEEAGIPLMTTFDSGDCYIRSGWGDEDAVLAFKAMNGNYEKKIYTHARPEINSINLGAFGEYLICNAASASYRSPIRNEHDVRTWRANVVTVDGKDQLFPYKWFEPLGSFGYPKAEIVRKEELPDGGFILSNEAKGAYATPMKQATRTIRYVPKGHFYIVKDVLVSEDGASHRFDHRFFIFNHDFKTVITKVGSQFKIERPKADLYIAVDGSSKFKFEYRDAYIHGLSGRDYDPDGPNQGKLGSAKGLQWSCDAPALTVISVLYPAAPGSIAPKIKFGKGCVTVNGVVYSTSD